MVIPPLSFIGAAFFPGSSFSATLKKYFRSGWAFFIPYLAAYLLYAWLDWPVNPSSAGPQIFATGLLPPSLLHVYWALHAIHVVLGFGALASRSRGSCEIKPQSATSKEDGQERPDFSNLPPPSSGDYLPTTRYALLATLPRAAPWLLLGLLFYIPGLYLEWPSDPWEHLRRINEWHAHDTVTAHSSWTKSSYFLPYSLTSSVTGLTQIRWLNLHYTVVCLLLSWQYYLLARAVGLKARASLIFVLLNALTMGNNIFSFYRYYGISSTIFAQIGAVALTRIAIGFARVSHTHLENGGDQQDLPRRRLPHASPAQDGGCLPHRSGIVTCPLLMLLIGFNHIQGLGIAGAGILAVVAWRFIHWRPAMLAWLSAAVITLSIAIVLWFPRHPAIDDVFRPEGWLNTFLGFNLLTPASPALERTIHIVGTLGIANLVMGLWLVAKRNDLSGWLTLMPLLMLALPCFALPFASMLASQKSVENIVVFHRLLFAVPLPLAMVVMGTHVWPSGKTRSENEVLSSFSRGALSGLLEAVRPLVASVGVAGFLLLSAHGSYNRFWHSLYLPPKDLQLETFVATSVLDPKRSAPADTYAIEAPLITEIRQAFIPSADSDQFRIISPPYLDADVAWRIQQLANALANLANRNHGSPIETERVSPEVLVRAASPSAANAKRIIADLTATDLKWVSLGGHAANSNHETGKIILSNSPGQVSHVFNSEMIPVKLGKRYLLSAKIRQIGGAGTNYLAVAWYDRTGRLLVSNQPGPTGAGSPTGWSTGVYSYYGLVNQPAEFEWTRYSISFGLGEPADIPNNAAYLRTGALLNENAVPNSLAEFTEVILWEKPVYQQIRLVAPDFRSQFTPGSQAAWLSRHWPPQYLAAQQMGTEELRFKFSSGLNSSVLTHPASD